MPMRTTDLDILEKNIRALADRCQEQDIPLRVHTKTHKIPEIAKMQLEAGAIGIVSQKVGEAEAMVAAGIKDILIPYNIIGKQKVDRLAALCNQATMTVSADSEITVRGLSEGMVENKASVGVLVECDTGGNRCGVQTPESSSRSQRTHPQPSRAIARGSLDLSEPRASERLHRRHQTPLR